MCGDTAKFIRWNYKTFPVPNECSLRVINREWLRLYNSRKTLSWKGRMKWGETCKEGLELICRLLFEYQLDDFER